MRAYTLGLIVASAAALTLPPSAGPSAVQSRRGALSTGAGVLAAAALGVSAPRAARAESTGSGLQYSVVKNGSGGGKPVTGDLIAIRFKGAVKETGAVFDDIMGSAEPYYTRVGSGNVLPAVEEAVKLMRSGDGSGCAARTPDAPIPAPGRAARARPRRAPTRSSPRPSAQSGS